MMEIRGNPLQSSFEVLLREQTVRREAIIKDLLGRWVSELEPVLICRARDGEILGLGVAGDFTATIGIRADAKI